MKKCPSTISGETDPVELKTHLVQMTSSRFKKSFKSVQNQVHPSTKAKDIFTGPQKMNFNLLLPNAFSTVWKTCKGNGTVFSISNPSKCCGNKRIPAKSPREICLSVWYGND
ncbi:uncharacterized protein LOC105077222 isoform X1 [Camelus bactrianus]|uniref:Uncharacterized protein LOC105077222 n=4 Tax=Camelus bactrianus TaxID=9837 RepID=A0A9W3F3X9_CAMBA|nr:uncharacterized protein LOC105077222 [Camelus bactrianus]XP_010963863.1 uncharacterized protein LOC105077222 [Camelus bactrianus]XP_045380439.1 uncharacterized protein LOC105077222 [Camelus bactrianus]